MVRITYEACIGCGKCAWDCFPGALVINNGRPSIPDYDRCLKCGHCIAICPKNAVYDDELNMKESLPIAEKVDPDVLLHSMRSRRSCRHYKDTPVSEAQLQMLLDAARSCPTAKNLQGTRYIAVTNSIDPLLDAALDALKNIGVKQLETTTDPAERRRGENFIRWARLREEDRTFDPLFFRAPLLLMFVATGDPRDAAAAAAYTELMAYSLGLGCLYSGYFTACAAGSVQIQKMLGIDSSEQVVRCLVLGHPDIKFLRTAPRKSVDITRL